MAAMQVLVCCKVRHDGNFLPQIAGIRINFDRIYKIDRILIPPF
jgi:hypothetical protein